MTDQGMDQDPLGQLEGWAAAAERRALRAHRWARVRRLRLPGRGRPAGRRPRRGPRVLLAALLVASLTGSAVWLSRDQWPGWAGTAVAPYPTVTHPAGLSATSGATAPPTDPFEDTPAATYPRGAAGFTMPPPERVGAWTARQVADALDQVRAALVAMYVDRSALVDHEPAAVLRLLAKGNRVSVRQRYREPARSAPAVLISRGARLAEEPPRVSGRTTARAGEDDKGRPRLEIITNYVVVYAFDAPDHGPGSRLALVHFETSWWLYRTASVRPADRGLWLGDSKSYLFGMDCDEAAKGLLAPWPHQRRYEELPTPLASPENPDGYYDPDRSLDVEDGCGA